MDSGKNLPGSFAFYDRDSFLWRTWQCCLGGGWDEFSGTWPRAGLMRNGTAFRRRPLARLTSGTGRLWWPTPGANDWKGSSRVGQRRGQLDEAVENLPAWIQCPHCENHLCTIHGIHAFECPCPSVEEWPTDPYRDRVPGRLAPEFSEWLLGFPIGWTELGDSATP